ncbi:MAG: hypothetical protein ACE5J7_01920 [Candidatus Aenigmatarchaeota archaeon]
MVNIKIKAYMKKVNKMPHSFPESGIPMGSMRYRKIEPKRPSVIRKGDKVKKCFYFQGMKQCLGVRCYWPRVGMCAIWDKINKNKRKNGRNGRIKKKGYTRKKTRRKRTTKRKKTRKR